MKKLLPTRREEMFSNLFEKKMETDIFDKVLGEFHYPQVDIKDKNDHYEIEIDVPGFSKDEITVEYKNHYLQIHGEKNQNKESTEEDGHYIRKERTHSSFKREFYVGEIESKAIEGSFKDGLLMINVPKSKTEKDEGETIKIE